VPAVWVENEEIPMDAIEACVLLAAGVVEAV